MYLLHQLKKSRGHRGCASVEELCSPGTLSLRRRERELECEELWSWQPALVLKEHYHTTLPASEAVATADEALPPLLVYILLRKKKLRILHERNFLDARWFSPFTILKRICFGFTKYSKRTSSSSTRALFWDHQNTNICVLLQYNRSLYKCRVLIHFFNSDSTTQWCCVLGDSLLHLRLHGLEMVKVKTDRPKACCGRRREAMASSDIFLSRFSLSNLLRCNLDDELRDFLVGM